MIGRSSKQPKQVENLGNSFLIRWNIEKSTMSSIGDLPPVECFNFEYNSVYKPKVLSKSEIIESIIREKYSVADEIAISMRRDGDEAKYQAHEDYVKFAKEAASAIMLEL